MSYVQAPVDRVRAVLPEVRAVTVCRERDPETGDMDTVYRVVLPPHAPAQCVFDRDVDVHDAIAIGGVRDFVVTFDWEPAA